MSKLGINGFGRIGRLVLRRLLEVNSPLEVVAINDLTSPKVLAYLLKHDSNYGPFPWSVDFTEDALIVDGKKITVYAEKEAQHIPWKAVGAELIVECTGFYTSAEKAQAHLTAGAKKVLITMGSRGALLLDNRQFSHIRAFPAVTVDTTGAGDAFNGALAASLAAGNSLVQAATWASAFASLAVELEGASNMPEFEQANARLRTL